MKAEHWPDLWMSQNNKKTKLSHFFINASSTDLCPGFIQKQENKIPGLFKVFLHFFQDSFFVDSKSLNTAYMQGRHFPFKLIVSA